MILLEDLITLEATMFELGISSISDNLNPNLYQNQFNLPPEEPNTIIFDCGEGCCCSCLWYDGSVTRVTIGPCDAGIFFNPGNSTKH